MADEATKTLTADENFAAALAHINGVNSTTPKDEVQEDEGDVAVLEGEEVLEEQVEKKEPEKKPAKQPKKVADKPEEKKEPEKKEAAKPEEKAAPKEEGEMIPEFNFEEWNKEQQALIEKDEDGEEKKPGEKKEVSKDEKKSLNPAYADIAKDLGIVADTDEDFRSEVLKLKTSQPQQVDDYDQRIVNLKGYTDKAKVNDEQLLLLAYTDKYGAEEASQQIEDLREAQGDAGIRIAARDIRGNINSEITRLESEKGTFRQKQDDAQKKFDTELATLVRAPTTISGIPIETESAKDLDYIKSKGFDKDLLNPANYVLAARLFRNRDSILAKAKSISEPVAKAIFSKGFKEAANTYRQKVFNQDIGNKTANGRPPAAAEKVTVESNFNKAQEHVKRARQG